MLLPLVIDDDFDDLLWFRHFPSLVIGCGTVVCPCLGIFGGRWGSLLGNIEDKSKLKLSKCLSPLFSCFPLFVPESCFNLVVNPGCNLAWILLSILPESCFQSCLDSKNSIKSGAHRQMTTWNGLLKGKGVKRVQVRQILELNQWELPLADLKCFVATLYPILPVSEL